MASQKLERTFQYRIDNLVVDEVEALAALGKRPGEIFNLLGANPELSEFDYSKSTIERIVRRLPAQPQSDSQEYPSWSLGNSEGDDARNILEARRGLILRHEGRIQRPANSEAQWVAKLLKTAPDFPMDIAWIFASVYGFRVFTERSTLALDDYLAFAPWRSLEEYNIYVGAIRLGWVDRPDLWKVLVEDQDPSLSWDEKQERMAPWRQGWTRWQA